LIGNERRGPNARKSAVVPTKSILTAANMPIIAGHHVLALQSPPLRFRSIFSPGMAWNYSVSIDVLGYLVEKLSGSSFG